MALCLFCVVPAWAARPFVTDDARLTTAGSCQLETWTRVYQDSREIWALPACNPTGNLEFTLGAGRASPDTAPSTTDYVFQLKTLFKPLERDGWAWGLAAGQVHHPAIQAGPNQLGNSYAYLPFTAAFAQDRFFLHTNLGWLRDKANREDRATWGLGGEYFLYPQLAVMAETFGDDKNKPYGQAGLRYWLIPDLLQIDTTVGQQHDGGRSSRWLSFGLRWTPAQIFGRRP